MPIRYHSAAIGYVHSDHVSDSHRCANCGERFDGHAGDGNPLAPVGRCPGNERDQRFPTSIKDDTKAQLEFGKRLHRFWNARPTTFKPV